MTTKTTEASVRPCPDWRDPESYAYTRNLSRDAWAWEFLRRNPRYRADYSRVVCAVRASRLARRGVLGAAAMAEAALRWGAFPVEDPDRDANAAAVLWRPDVSSFVLPLRAEVEPSSGRPAFAGLRDKALLVTSEGAIQHILFRQGTQRLQLAVQGGDLFAARRLFTDIPASRLDQRLALLRRFNRLAAQSDLGDASSATGGCYRRLLFVLRTLDGARAGASQQEIAEALFESRDIKRDWDSPTGALRHQVRRAIQRGSWLSDGGYLRLLR